MKSKVLIIAGATCTGKSDVAIEIAKEFNGEIISADSMQIYKYCDIGTAKITPNEMQGIKHHCLSIISPLSEFSVSEFKQIAEERIKEIIKKEKLPILVGGTGLYLEAIMKNYDFAQTTKNDELRQKYEQFLREKGKDALYDLLVQKNPEKAKKIEMNNTRRVIRALEIEDNSTKEPPLQTDAKFDYLFCVLTKNREALYDKINSRVDQMINNGLEREVRNLLERGVQFSNQCMKSIGYKEWEEYFSGQITKFELIEKIKQNTRRYAKRQITWFKHRDNAVYFSVDDKNFNTEIKNMIKEWIKNE